MIHAVITDDEASARASIRALLAREPDIRVVAECRTAPDTLRVVSDLEPDLLFLDVQLTGASGIQILERIPGDRFPVVIFVTAFDEYAIKAFDHHAADYLLKPYSDARFRVALQRARSRIEMRGLHRFHREVLTLARHVPVFEPGTDDEQDADVHRTDLTGAARRYLTRIAIKTGSRVSLIGTGEIDWIEADGDYVRVHSGGKSLLYRSTMGDLERRLDPARFVRVHRSTIVQISAVLELRHRANDVYLAALTDGAVRPISQRGREKLASKLGGRL